MLVHLSDVGPVLKQRVQQLYPPSDQLVSHVFRRFLSQFLTDFHEILYGLFARHSATTKKFQQKTLYS